MICYISLIYRNENTKQKYFSAIRLLEPIQMFGGKLTVHATKTLHDGECKFECGRCSQWWARPGVPVHQIVFFRFLVKAFDLNHC